jgi:hypothetical protein
MNIAHKGKLTPALLCVYLIRLPNKYSQLRRQQRVSRAASSYVGTPPLGTPLAMSLGYSLGGYLEPITPPLATSSRCHQLCRHAAFGHSVGNDPRGLSRAGHAASGYVVALPPATSTRHLYLRWHTASAYIVGNNPRVFPWGLSRAGHATSGYIIVLPPATSTCHLYLRWHTASTYIIDNDLRVLPQGLPRVGHASAIYVDMSPPVTSSAMILGTPSGAIPSRSRHLRLHSHAASSYINTLPLSTVAHCLCLHHRQ